MREDEDQGCLVVCIFVDLRGEEEMLVMCVGGGDDQRLTSSITAAAE